MKNKSKDVELKLEEALFLREKYPNVAYVNLKNSKLQSHIGFYTELDNFYSRGNKLYMSFVSYVKYVKGIELPYWEYSFPNEPLDSGIYDGLENYIYYDFLSGTWVKNVNILKFEHKYFSNYPLCGVGFLKTDLERVESESEKETESVKEFKTNKDKMENIENLENKVELNDAEIDSICRNYLKRYNTSPIKNLRIYLYSNDLKSFAKNKLVLSDVYNYISDKDRRKFHKFYIGRKDYAVLFVGIGIPKEGYSIPNYNLETGIYKGLKSMSFFDVEHGWTYNVGSYLYNGINNVSDKITDNYYTAYSDEDIKRVEDDYEKSKNIFVETEKMLETEETEELPEPPNDECEEIEIDETSDNYISDLEDKLETVREKAIEYIKGIFEKNKDVNTFILNIVDVIKFTFINKKAYIVGCKYNIKNNELFFMVLDGVDYKIYDNTSIHGAFSIEVENIEADYILEMSSRIRTHLNSEKMVKTGFYNTTSTKYDK